MKSRLEEDFTGVTSSNDLSPETLALIDDECFLPRSCWDNTDDPMSAATNDPSFLRATSPAAFPPVFLQRGNAQPTVSPDVISPQFLASSFPAMQAPFNTMGPVGMRASSGILVGENAGTDTGLSSSGGAARSVLPSLLTSTPQAFQVLHGNQGGLGSEAAGAPHVVPTNNLSPAISQLKTAISQAPREVLATVLTWLLDDTSRDLLQPIWQLFEYATIITAKPESFSSPGAVHQKILLNTTGGTKQSTAASSASSAMMRPSSVFLDPTHPALGGPVSHASTVGSTTTTSNNSNPNKGLYRSGAPSASPSPTKRKGGAGNRLHKNHKEEEQALCSRHAQLRPLKHLQRNEETHQWECIHGYHCLVESPKGSPLAHQGLASGAPSAMRKNDIRSSIPFASDSTGNTGHISVSAAIASNTGEVEGSTSSASSQDSRANGVNRVLPPDASTSAAQGTAGRFMGGVSNACSGVSAGVSRSVDGAHEPSESSNAFSFPPSSGQSHYSHLVDVASSQHQQGTGVRTQGSLNKTFLQQSSQDLANNLPTVSIGVNPNRSSSLQEIFASPALSSDFSPQYLKDIRSEKVEVK